MTLYYVNGQEVDIPAGFSSFNQVFKYIETKCLKADAIIREVRGDGRQLALESLGGESESMDQTGDFEKIEIFTGTLADIAGESISGAIDYLEKIVNDAPALATKFQDFPEPEDFNNLGSLCEGFIFLSVLLDKLMLCYKFTIDDITIRGVPAKEHLNKFADIVQQLNESQEKQEYLMIADTIEYEILPIVPIWREIFEAFSQKINQVN